MRHLPRACRICLAWGTFNSLQCLACRSFAGIHPVGQCRGCARRVPVNAGYCRLCRHQARLLAGPGRYGPSELLRVARTGQQLFLAHTQRTLWRHHANAPTPACATPSPSPEYPAPRPAPPWTAQELFTLPPHLAGDRVLRGDHARQAHLAALGHAAEALGLRKGWTSHMRTAVANTLEALIARHPPGTQTYPASSVAALAGTHRNTARAIEALSDLGMLHDDREDPLDRWLARQLAPLSQETAAQVTAWAQALRHGSARHHATSELTWRNYLTQLMPALQAWSTAHTSLREITPEHILEFLHTPTAGDGHGRVSASRSLFRFLARERLIFADPIAQLPPTATARTTAAIPTRLHPSAVTQLASTRRGPAAWLVTVMVAHHALNAADIRALTLDDVDLTARTLRARGHVRPLDAITEEAIHHYLTYRTQRWPHTTNTHLMVNQHAAHHHDPVSRDWIRACIRTATTNLRTLRADRIPEEVEAHHRPDLLHIAAIFAIHPDSAKRYVDGIYTRDPTP